MFLFSVRFLQVNYNIQATLRCVVRFVLLLAGLAGLALLARLARLARLLAVRRLVRAAHHLAEAALGRVAQLEVLVGLEGTLEVLVVRVLAVDSHALAHLAGRTGVVAVLARLEAVLVHLGTARSRRRAGTFLGENHFGKRFKVLC